MELFFAGLESYKFTASAKAIGVESVLMNWYHLRPLPEDIVIRRKKDCPDLKIFIDSGAFTFVTNPELLAKAGDLDKLVAEYAAWLDKHVGVITACAELDVESVVGYDKVLEWDEKYFQPLRAKGMEVISVWHEERGTEGWKEMVNKYPYVGFPSGTGMGITEINKFLSIARDRGTRVHGFGCTTPNIMLSCPFASVDSTTWNVAVQFGEMDYWDGINFRRLSKEEKKDRQKMQPICDKYGLNMDLIIADKSKEVGKLALANWVEFYKAKLKEAVKPREFWSRGEKLPPEDALDALDSYTGVCKMASGMGYNYEEMGPPQDDDLENHKKFIKLVRAVLACDRKPLDELNDTDLQWIGTGFGIKGITDRNELQIKMFKEGYKNWRPYKVEAKERVRPSNDLIVAENRGPGAPIGSQNNLKHGLYKSDRMPTYACNSCQYKDLCPKFEPDSVCEYLGVLEDFDVRDVPDVMSRLEDLITTDAARLRMGLAFERMAGGTMDQHVSSRLDALHEKLVTLANLKQTTVAPLGEEGGKNILEALFTKEVKVVDVEVKKEEPKSDDAEG